jgi:DNA-binding phage protein
MRITAISTVIVTEKIAEGLKLLMKDKGITAQDIINKGMSRQQVYSVLRMGNTPRPDYKISTFIKILSLIGVHIEFHDLAKRSNLDLDKTGQN